MKLKKILLSLLVLPFVSGCGESEGTNIPIEEYVPNLPEIKNKNVGDIKEDDNFVYFDFYEISDFHGAVEYNKDDDHIGIEKLSTYFDEKRSNNPGGTILLSGGDMWQGTADSNVTKGNLVTYSMNVMNFDAMTLGNHEYDWTDSFIRNNKKKANFPFLAANIIDDGTGKNPDYVQASVVLERGDYKIGVIGTIGDSIKNTILASSVKGLTFEKEVATVKSEVKKLEEAGCDIIVWSSHNDLKELKTKINGETDLGVDLIFGGHSHTNLVDESNGIPMIETASKAEGIAHCQLKLNKTTKEVSAIEGYGYETNLVEKEFANDPDITMIYDQYKKDYINPIKNRKIAKANGDFDKKIRLPNLAVEAMYNTVKKDYPNVRAAFTNINGGVRQEIKSGTVTYGNIYEAFPFDNELVIIEINGKAMKKNVTNPPSNAAIYQDVLVATNLNSSETYQFVTTEFLATSSDFFLGSGNVVAYTKINLRDCISDYMKEKKTLNADDYKSNAKKEFNNAESF